MIGAQTKTKTKSKKNKKKKNNTKEEIENGSIEKESLGQQFNPNYMFDYLVSPLKSDMEFGIFLI